MVKSKFVYNTNKEGGFFMTHIVFFKLKDYSKENQEKVAQILNKMQGKIDYVHEMEVGIDFLHSDRSFDLALIVRLDKKDLDTYQANELHCACKKEFAPYIEYSKTVDFE